MISRKGTVIELIALFSLWLVVLVFRSNIYVVVPLVLFIANWVLFVSPRLHNDSLAERGLGDKRTLYLVRLDTLKQAARYSVFLFSAVLLILIPAGVLFHTYVSNVPYPSLEEILLTWLRYIPWAYLQQLLFLSFYAVRFKKLNLPDNLVILLTSIVFGLHHIPNWALVLATFVIEILLTYCFLKAPNIFMYSIVHGLGGTLYGTFIGLSLFVGW